MRIRQLQPRDAQAALDLRVQAFSTGMHVPADDEGGLYAADERRLVAEVDGRVVGHFAAWSFLQHVGGRGLPMGGVGGVATAFDWRGRGVGTALMTAGLDLMAEHGDVLSLLYPSTPAFYRFLGWELGGERLQRRIATRDLTTLPPPSDDVDVRPFNFDDDFEAVAAVHDQEVGREPGALTGSDRWLRRMLMPDPDEPEFVLVAQRGDDIVGFVACAKDSPHTELSPWDVRVVRLVGRDWDVERTLWHVVAANHPVAHTTTFVAAASDPLLVHLPAQTPAPTAHSHAWMIRIVDLVGAIAARGWPAGQGSVVLAVEDLQRGANAGTWRIGVEGGRGRATRVEDAGTASIDIGALSAIFVGGASASTMARAGRLVATPNDVAAMDALFATPAPVVRDFF